MFKKFIVITFSMWMTFPSYGREPKLEREAAAGAFWSLIVSLDMTQAKCLGTSVCEAELKYWLESSKSRFSTVRHRFPVASRLDAQFQDVMDGYSRFPLDADRFLKMDQLKSSLYKHLAEVPKPSSTPIFEVGKQTFVAHCASCHGFKGEGDGPLSSKLRFRPRSLVQGDRYSTLSPISVYAAVFQGVSSTEMPGYSELLTNLEIWSVSFYVAALDHLGESSTDCNFSLDLEALSSMTDRQLVISRREELNCANFLFYARRVAPFDLRSGRGGLLGDFDSDLSGYAKDMKKRISLFALSALFVAIAFVWILLRGRAGLK